MQYLDVKSPQGRKRLELDKEPLTIGRAAGNGLIITDDRASRAHCVIEPAEDGFYVRDLNSRNGTRLNDAKIERSKLASGDVVRIGDVLMEFIDPMASAPDNPKRRNTPDYSAEALEFENSTAAILHSQDTLDLDLNEAVTDAETNYEVKLREICAAALEKPFDEQDIALVDTRGQTVHQAQSAGLDTGKDGDIGEGIRLFRLLVLTCFRSRATDLHIEPRAEDALVRIRVDGYMITAVELTSDLFKRTLGVVKILCEIDISRKNAVQEGHFSTRCKGRRVDYRVSLTPTLHGQKLVIRVLDSANAPNRLHELDLIGWMYEKLRTIATRDAGLLLACGPTGSGKTTSLYSALREIDIEQRNVITIEDPVEYYLEGATQIPVNAKQDVGFADVLRSVMRQDPDVIFVGEIRDIETATVAMQASMTGHLVFSTVHAKDSIGAIFRLLDLGIETYLVANALNMILAQRLVRVLCETCKRAVRPTPQQVMTMNIAGGVPFIHAPVGCKKCLRTGYVGRQAIFELLEINDSMRDVILKTPTIKEIRKIANQGLFQTLQQNGLTLVQNGVTSFDEIDRVSGSE